MAGAFGKDIWRTITRNRKRFISILAICALGVTMVTGLRASCFDLRQSADAFFDSQHLYDLSIQSTLGLTNDDVTALSQIDGVQTAEGTWEESTYTDVGNKRLSVDVKALSGAGINAPYVVEGMLPTNANEVAVTNSYLEQSGASIGDTLTLESADEDSAVFQRNTYTIVGVVIDPTELTNPTGPIAIRASASPDCCFFVTPDAVNPDNTDVFTAIYIACANTQDLQCYSNEYTNTVDAVMARINDIASEREQARTDQIKQDAHATIDDEEAQANEQFQDAESQLADAQGKLDDGWSEIERNKAQLASGQQQLQDGQAQLDSQASQLADARQQLNDGQAQVTDGLAQLNDGITQVDDGIDQIDTNYAQITDGLAQIASGRDAINAACDEQIEKLNASLQAGFITQEQFDQGVATIETERSNQLKPLTEQETQLTETKQILEERKQEAESQKQELVQQKAQLEASQQQLDANKAQLDSGEAALSQARTQLEQSKKELASGQQQLEEGAEQLRQGQAELDSQRSEYESSKADALEQIAQARADVESIEPAQWYTQTRDSNAGYNSVESDASSIEAIGLVFPVVFIVVAVLIALTAITRMVEEERGLIGTYKSLGYSRGAILMKYIVYALGACLIGCVIGEICGFIAFPMVLFYVFEVMYQLPQYLYSFDLLYGIGGPVFFILGIVGAAILACRSELKQTPAALMRPKTPRAGSRILLEHIGFIWKRMSFLNKVTARNIFRYKKRFLMTIFGIMGCMALLICGFAIRDSVHALSPMQYEDINRYDVLAVVDQSNYDNALASLENDGRVANVLGLTVDSVTMSPAAQADQKDSDLQSDQTNSAATADKTDQANQPGQTDQTDKTSSASKETLQLFVVPDGAPLTTFINLRTSATTPCDLTNEGMLLTRNAADLLGISDGDNVHVETSTLDAANVPVEHVIDNYLGNAAYITQSTYAQLFGKQADPNGFFINLASDNEADQIAFADDLASQDDFMTVTSTQQMREEFSQSFSLINTIVYVIIVLAAALAFVVLFTLSTTNISERERELATIKVLGFRRREVNHYVNKETILLTLVGVLVGIPAGYAFSNSLTYILKMPSIYFAVTIEPLSYVIAAGLTLLFAWIVALLSNRALAKIDMIEALKSVE